MDDLGGSKCLKASDLWSSDDYSDDATDKIDDTTLPEEDWLSGNLDFSEEDSTDTAEEEEITFVKTGNRRHLKVNGKKKLNMNGSTCEPTMKIQAEGYPKGNDVETEISGSGEVSAIEKNIKIQRCSEPQKILNTEELLQKRADRFGTSDFNERKRKSITFGTPDLNILKKRSQRFATPDLKIVKRRSETFGTPDLNLLKKRSERFATPDLQIVKRRSETFETKDLNLLKRRSERFATPDLNTAKRRIERFGMQPFKEVEASEIIKKRQKRFGIVDGVELETEYGKFSDLFASFNSEYKWTKSQR